MIRGDVKFRRLWSHPQLCRLIYLLNVMSVYSRRIWSKRYRWGRDRSRPAGSDACSYWPNPSACSSSSSLSDPASSTKQHHITVVLRTVFNGTRSSEWSQGQNDGNSVMQYTLHFTVGLGSVTFNLQKHHNYLQMMHSCQNMPDNPKCCPHVVLVALWSRNRTDAVWQVLHLKPVIAKSINWDQQ